MATNWTGLLLAAATGGLAATLISAFAKYCVFHPVISVRLDAKKGSYVPTWFSPSSEERAGAQALLGSDGTVPNVSEVRYLRLHVENTGLSTIKNCSGYITKMTKRASGIESISKQEVVALGWAHKGTEPRDIPRGGFFHLDVASLYRMPDRSLLRISPELPSSLWPFVSDDKATYELEILVAADNARPRHRIPVKFTHDPNSYELEFESVNRAQYPWWARWRWLRSRLGDN
jgi:hypothetical protein